MLYVLLAHYLQILPAWVKSIEDHGYIVDFGVEGKSGFLLKKNTSEFVKLRNRGRSLCVGQVVQCVVLAGADARSVPVTINPSAVKSSLVPADAFVAIHSLLPGLQVNAAVKEVSMSMNSCVYVDLSPGLPALYSADFVQ